MKVKELSKQVAVCVSMMAAGQGAWADDHGSKEVKATHKAPHLVFESEDGSVKYFMDGRLYLDVGFFSAPDELVGLKTTFEVRRARTSFKTIVHDDWQAELDIEFKDEDIDEPDPDQIDVEDLGLVDDDGEPIEELVTDDKGDNKVFGAIEVKDFWVAYNGFDNTTIKFGNHKPGFSMDEVTSSRYITFIERALPNAFEPDRRMGLGVANWGDQYFASAAMFTDGPFADKNQKDHDPFGFSLRGVYAPVLNAEDLVHVGFSYYKYNPDSGTTLNDRAEAQEFEFENEAEFNQMPKMLTAEADFVKSQSALSLEAAGRRGPFHVQAEYITADVDRYGDLEDPEFSGWYIQGGFFLTGETRGYRMDQAEFTTVKPYNESGAWEVALRLSSLDLTDEDAEIFGGSADNITLALNWYANENVTLKFNYIRADLDEHATGDEEEGDFDDDFINEDAVDDEGYVYEGETVSIYAMRLQYLF